MMTRLWTALGDSFTHGTGDNAGGWINRTFTELKNCGHLDALDNRSTPGLTIADVIDQQCHDLVPCRVVSAIAGANDLLQPHLDAEALDTHVEQLLEYALDHGDIVLTSTCPDFTPCRTTSSRRLAARINQLNTRARTLAAHNPRIVLVDAHTILDDPQLWSNDGIHPSPSGHLSLAVRALHMLTTALEPNALA